MVSRKDPDAHEKKPARRSRISKATSLQLSLESEEKLEPAAASAAEGQEQAESAFPKRTRARRAAASAAGTARRKKTAEAGEDSGAAEKPRARRSRAKPVREQQRALPAEDSQVFAYPGMDAAAPEEEKPLSAAEAVSASRAQAEAAGRDMEAFASDNGLPEGSSAYVLDSAYAPLGMEDEVIPAAPADDAEAGSEADEPEQEKGGSFSSVIQKLTHSSVPAAQAAPAAKTAAAAPAARSAQPEEAPEAKAAPEEEGQQSAVQEEASECELSEIEQSVCEHVAAEEQKASITGDSSSFTTHSQYGDGRVETAIIGDAAIPSTIVDADPGHGLVFFRSCRAVKSPDIPSTPLPDEGFWIPAHPAPRHGAAVQAETRAHEEQAPAPAESQAAAPSAPEQAEAGKILVCWVGKVDISAALRRDTINPGPIRMLLEHVPTFEHVVLLTTTNQNVLDNLCEWLSPCLPNKTLDVLNTQAADLSDHVSVCQAAASAVEDIIARCHLPADGTGITFHLSPGSPVTHAILLLLATLRYKGSTLMQTRLTGLGKAPDILTISIDKILAAPGLPVDDMPKLTVRAASETPAPVQAVIREREESPLTRFQPKGRSGRRNGDLPKGRTPVRGTDLLKRFRSSGKNAAPKASPSRLREQQRPYEPMGLDMDTPQPVQEGNGLRGAPVSIGKPTRVSPIALQPKEGDPPLISAALGNIYKKMQRVATMLLPILLLGEAGSGKSRLARYLHEWSGRSGKFVSLDCAGLTDEMFFCELFGRSGGNGVRPLEGAFRKARSGTLFLENVNLLTPTQQSLLLRVLAPVGETKIYLPAKHPFPACTVRVRIIASAESGLLNDIRAGRFRADLYYRLAGVSTTLPAVREYSYTERENLLRSFLVDLQRRLGQCWNFSGDAWQTLIDEKWPGNLREVARILQQICLLSDADTTISREDVLQQLRQGRFSGSTLRRNVVEDDHGDASSAFLSNAFAPFGASDEPEDEDYGPDMEDMDDAHAGHDEHAAGDFFVLGSGQNLNRTLDSLRDNMIMEAMDKARGNRNEAASLLGISPSQLNYALTRMKNADHYD